MGSWGNVERCGHEGEEEDQQSKERSPATAGIERRGVVDGADAEETHGEDHGGPKIPAFPKAKDCEHDEASGKEERGIPVCARVERAKNVAAIELGMEDAVEEGGNGEDETDERAGSADIKQGAVGEDGGANQDEGSKGAVQVWEGNEKRVGGANMVVTAGEEMAEFMGEENKEKSKCERETGGEAEGVLVKESKGAEKFIGGEGLVLGIGGGELRAGDEAGAESEEEEDAGEEQHFSGRTVRSRNVADAIGRGGAPIDVGREGRRRIYWEGWGHGIFCA